MSRSHAEKVARALNAHHARTCAGFYPATGGRAFGARVVKGVLEITYDFRNFRPVDAATFAAHDHNGRPISLPKQEVA